MDARDIIALELASREGFSMTQDRHRLVAKAILNALAANQLAVVGREPTREMNVAGTRYQTLGANDVQNIWRAMFDAISPSPLSTGDRR